MGPLGVEHVAQHPGQRVANVLRSELLQEGLIEAEACTAPENHKSVKLCCVLCRPLALNLACVERCDARKLPNKINKTLHDLAALSESVKQTQELNERTVSALLQSHAFLGAPQA